MPVSPGTPAAAVTEKQHQVSNPRDASNSRDVSNSSKNISNSSEKSNNRETTKAHHGRQLQRELLQQQVYEQKKSCHQRMDISSKQLVFFKNFAKNR
jgi:hypothetical protein